MSCVTLFRYSPAIGQLDTDMNIDTGSSQFVFYYNRHSYQSYLGNIGPAYILKTVSNYTEKF